MGPLLMVPSRPSLISRVSPQALTANGTTANGLLLKISSDTINSGLTYIVRSRFRGQEAESAYGAAAYKI